MADSDPRVALVEEHVRLENAHDFAACIEKFGRARYEVMAGDETFEGAQRVAHFLNENRRAFPDFRFTANRISPSTHAVIVEGRFTGTQNGFWRGLPPTGRQVDFPMCVVFDFEGDVMVNERLYFDLGTPLQQLGVQFDPDTRVGKAMALLGHPYSIVRGALRALGLFLSRRRS